MVFADLVSLVPIDDPTTLEVNLAALAALLTEAQQRTAVPEPIAHLCRIWLRSIGWDGVGDDARSLSERMNHLLRSLRDGPEQRAALRRSLHGQQQPSELLANVLRIFSEQGQTPVLILDGLDKVPPERAPDLFRGRPLAGTAAGGILTLPLSMVYDAEFPALGEDYDNVNTCTLRAIQVYTRRDGEREENKEGVRVLKKVLSERIRAANEPAKNVVAQAAIKLVIEASGGNIREMNKLLQESMIKASLDGRTQVKAKDVQAAIADRRETYRRGYQTAFRPILEQVLRSCEMTNIAELERKLLDGLWVVEYRNGDTWYDLPQPVRELVEKLPKATGAGR